MLRVLRPELGSSRPSTPSDRDELAQVLGVGGGEGFENRLIGIADAHPVAALPRQRPQDLFLQPRAVLRLILQDVDPLALQRSQIIRLFAQHFQRQADQVLKIDRPTISQRAVIIDVNLGADLCQRQFALVSGQ